LPCDKRPYTDAAVAGATSPLESGRVLEGMDVLDVGGGGAYCLRCVFFSFIASYRGRCISPPWAGCAFRIYDWLRSQGLARLGPNILAIDPSGDNIGVATRHTATDPCLATLSLHHALAETLVPEPK
jgi:hypothetical protein